MPLRNADGLHALGRKPRSPGGAETRHGKKSSLGTARANLKMKGRHFPTHRSKAMGCHTFR